MSPAKRYYSDRTLKLLWGGALTCAFPNCSVRVVQEATRADPEEVIGEIAHIVAHSENGPRSDPEYPSEFLSDYRNLIILCPTHHALVDKQENTYTVDDLRRWKEDHEREVRGVGSAQPSGSSDLFNVPLPLQRFVGRAVELEALERMLTHSTEPIAVSASIQGLAGIGKSEIAIQLAHMLAARGEYPGGIFWIDAENPDLEKQWSQPRIAGALGVKTKNLADAANRVVELLSRQREKALVILDNVGTWTARDSPRPLPVSTNVQLLVTTRKQDLGGGELRQFQLSCLDRGLKEDEQLLLAIAGREIEPGVADLLEYLDGHTLAVETAGIQLRRSGRSAAEYLRALTRGDLLSPMRNSSTRHKRTFEQVLEEVWMSLDGSTREAWQVAAQFSNASAGRLLSADVGLDEERLDALQEWHLVKFDGARWRMHRLVRGFGQRAGTDEQKHAAKRAFLAGCAKYADRINVIDGFVVFVAERPHLEAAEADIDCLGVESLSQFHDRLGLGLQRCGEFVEARAHKEAALQAALDFYGEAHPVVAERLNNLALLLQELGELDEARRLFELTLESDLQTYEDDHPEVSIDRNNLARVLHDMSEFEEAHRLFVLAIESDIRNFGEGHEEVAIKRNNLARLLHDTATSHARGESFGPKGLATLAKAEGLMLAAIESDLRTFGEAHSRVAHGRLNLARILHSMNRFEEAETLFAKAIESDVITYGDQHPEVAVDRHYLARLYLDSGRWAEAQRLLELAIDCALETFGRNHFSVAARRSDLARVLSALGDSVGAEREAREALRVARRMQPGSRLRVEIEGCWRETEW